MSRNWTIDAVKYALSRHHWDCVFELDAPQKITQRLRKKTKDQWYKDIKGLQACFIQSEIYCPHEGVDRTKEIGVSLNWN